jgi:hypothetical protein
MRPNVLDELTLERLQTLLALPSEESCLDFKQALDLGTDRGRVEFAKDVLAFANSGGGHMIVGVSDGKPRDIVGLAGADLRVLGEPKLANDAIHKYTGGYIIVSTTTHIISTATHQMTLGLVYVPAAARKVPAQDNGVYPEPANPNKQHWAFRQGDMFIRAGTESRKVLLPGELEGQSPMRPPVPEVKRNDSPKFANPYDVAAAAATNMFKGREYESDRLLDSIETGAHTVVYGLQRIGKTSLVRDVLQTKLQTRPSLIDRVLFAEINFQSLGNEYSYRSFLDSLVQAIANNVPKVSAHEISAHMATIASQYERGSKREMLVGFSSLLEKLGARAKKKIVIFLDEFSELCRAIERNEQRDEQRRSQGRPEPALHPHELPVDVDMMQWFGTLLKNERIKGRIVFIFAARPFVADYDEYRNLQVLKLTKSITLYHLDQAAARALITEPLEGKISYVPDAVDYLCTLTAGQPYLLQMFLREVVDRLKRDHRTAATKRDVQAVEDVLISEGPAHEAHFKVLDSDYSLDDVIEPKRATLGRGVLALVAKIGHEQREGWVNTEAVCDAMVRHNCRRADAYKLLDQLVRAKILEEKQAEDRLLVRMTIPLLRKRYVGQNMYLKYFRDAGS